MKIRNIIPWITLASFVLLISACGGSGGTSSNGNGRPQLKIVFAGDSIISRGGDWNRFFDSRVSIRNDGMSGLESWQLVNTIENSVASKPDKIFIEIGGNNVMNRREGILIGDVSTIIDKIRKASPATKIFFISMVPMQDAFISALMDNYDNQIGGLCAGKNVRVISVFGLFTNSATVIEWKYYDPNDGIHLNGDGYQLFANAIRGDVMS